MGVRGEIISPREHISLVIFLLILAILFNVRPTYSSDKTTMAFATGDYLYEYWATNPAEWLDISALPWQNYDYIIEHSAKITVEGIHCAENNFLRGDNTVLCLEGLYPYCGFGKDCSKETIYYLPEVLSNKNIILSLTVKHNDRYGNAVPIEDIINQLPNDALLIENLLRYIGDKGYAGINIDFENFEDSAATSFKTFLTQLKIAITTTNPSLLLFIDIQPGILRSEDKPVLRQALEELSADNVLDLWLLMGYDYAVSLDTPMGPWIRNNGVCVRDDLARLADIVSSNRIVYLLPFHLWCESCPDSLAPWRTVTNIPLLEETAIQEEYLEKINAVEYTVRGVDHQNYQYFNDAACLGQKVARALDSYPDLAGFGVWEISYDLDNGSLSRAIFRAIHPMNLSYLPLLLF